METTTPKITTSVYVDPDRTMVTMPHGRYMMHSDDARAVRIACNAHDKLVEALRKIVQEVHEGMNTLNDNGTAVGAEDFEAIYDIARAALAKLKGA